MTVCAKFVSIWNNGEYRIETDCKVNTKTKEVFEIEKICDSSILNELQVIDKEFIIIDGIEFRVRQKEEKKPEEFWYD